MLIVKSQTKAAKITHHHHHHHHHHLILHPSAFIYDGDLINANFAFKYLYRHKQKFANKRLCIFTE